jgi:putative endonuclease
MKTYYVYIMTNKENGTIYVGVTNNLARRTYEHKNKITKGFTSKYSLDKLVYFEETSDVESAIAREKQIKAWRRHWKLELVNKSNPDWEDLSEELDLLDSESSSE